MCALPSTSTHTETQTSPLQLNQHTHVEACASLFWEKWQTSWHCCSRCEGAMGWMLSDVKGSRVGERSSRSGNIECFGTGLMIWVSGGGGGVSEHAWHMIQNHKCVTEMMTSYWLRVGKVRKNDGRSDEMGWENWRNYSVYHHSGARTQKHVVVLVIPFILPTVGEIWR